MYCRSEFMLLRFLEEKQAKKAKVMVGGSVGFARWETSSRQPRLRADSTEPSLEARQEGSFGLQTALQIMAVFPDILICSSKALGLAVGLLQGKQHQQHGRPCLAGLTRLQNCRDRDICIFHGVPPRCLAATQKPGWAGSWVRDGLADTILSRLHISD